MKLHTDGDTVGIETDARDLDIIRATRDTVTGLSALATAAGFPRSDGSCDQCGNKDVLRPFVLADDGSAVSLDLCADCQQGFVKQTMAATDGETVDVDISGDEPDPIPEELDVDPDDLPGDLGHELDV